MRLTTEMLFSSVVYNCIIMLRELCRLEFVLHFETPWAQSWVLVGTSRDRVGSWVRSLDPVPFMDYAYQ